ncbi:50S ribosomal protein L13 [Patescibacteria group bacterium]|nr:50S ribosomal protein L13 [Patescibacteria group bacterium]MBU1868689.1 50S ribosomal protein L13 [Patescibacteria group bacterium]
MFDKNIKPNEIQREWFIIDASEEILGRMSTHIADILRGKHRPYFSPQWDMGDYVIVVNAEKVKLTGKKDKLKMYYRHTGYPGGFREETAGKMRARKPERMVQLAVKRMLPKNRLSRQIIKKMFVYAGSEHPHGAQQPKELKF